VYINTGGSLAVANGFQKSGLSKWLAEVLSGVMPKQKELALIVILIFNQIGTEVNVILLSLTFRR
jgi:di/tricarboxylate transporter